MTVLDLQATDRYSLLRIGEAWRNRAGLTTLLITYVTVILLVVLGTRIGGVLAMLFSLVAFLGAVAGLTGAGMQFMDQANERPVRSTTDALLASPMVLLRGLALMLALLLLYVAFVAIAAVILFICKIPGLGALLYAVALPFLTFLGALVALAATVCALVASAGLWNGQTLRAALSQGFGVATQRPLQAFLNLMLLGLAVGIVSFVIFIFVMSGFSVTAGLSASILGSQMGGGLMGAMGMFGGPMMDGGFGGRPEMMAGGAGSGALVLGGLVGAGLVFAVAQSVVWAVFALGLSLTYLKITEGLDVAASQAQLDAALARTKAKAQQAAAEAKRRAQEVQASAQQRLHESRQPRPSDAAAAASAAAPPQAPPDTGAAAALQCPACKAPITANDAFCGECGHKLR